MIATGTLNIGKGTNCLPAINRWTPWKVAIEFVGFDLTGGTFRSQFRSFLDQASAPLIDLQNASGTAEGISVSVATVSGVTISTLELRINETTIEGLPFTNPRGGDLELFWDLHIAATGLPKWRALQGEVPIKAGSTQ